MHNIQHNHVDKGYRTHPGVSELQGTGLRIDVTVHCPLCARIELCKEISRSGDFRLLCMVESGNSRVRS